jgi:phage-related protein
MSKPDTPIDWEGTSRSDLLSFPADAQQNAGFQLGRLQQGLDPTDWRPLTNLGKGISGVKEIRIWASDGTYRVAYIARFNNTISVLHSFEKKTQQTSKTDIALIIKRYKDADARHKKVNARKK